MTQRNSINRDLWAKARSVSILGVAAILEMPVKNNKAMCFNGHDKNSPSLTFYPKQDRFFCFGCGARGSPIDLVVGVKGVSAIDAVHLLLGQSRGSFDQKRDIENVRAVEIASTRTAPRKFHIDSDVYSDLLTLSPISDVGLRYLVNERGFKRSTIEHFRIGELDPTPSLHRQLLDRWGVDRLVQCGVYVRQERNGKNIERLFCWDKVLLFPFYDGDHVVYLQGRRLNGAQPKYLGLSKIEKPLYNINCIQVTKPRQRLYVCEGIPDALAAYEKGWSAVAVLGAHSFREEWVPMMLPYSVTVVPDGDSAGKKLYESVAAAFHKYGRSVEALQIPAGSDLADVLRAHKLGVK